MTVTLTEIIAVIMLIFNSIGVIVLLKKFVWDTKNQAQKELKDRQDAVKDRITRDIQIKDWITLAIQQQNEHCKLWQQVSNQGLKDADMSVKEQQKEQAAEMKEMKSELRSLSNAVIRLTEEIGNLKEVIKELKRK